MINIGIDARLYSQTGVGVYISNLLYYLQELMDDGFAVFVYLLTQDLDKIQFKNKNFIKRTASYRWHTFSEQLGFAKLLYEDKLDLMHFTYFSYPILYKKKFVSTIHDVTPLLFKTGKASTKNSFLYEIKYLFFKGVLTSQIKNASAIITPTKTVKSQIVKFYGQKISDKIYPIYEGINREIIKVKPNKSLEKNFNKDFFIYVGNFYPHKNVKNLVEAFSKINKDYKLILIGPDDFFTKKLNQLINRLNLQRQVIFYHNPSKEDLVFFYQNSSALIHPSLSEGFGLPLIEAAYFGLPIIASNIGVFAEVLDNKYLSFNPNDVDDIVGKINEFIKKRKTFNYSDLLKRYSFKKMAEQTLELYSKVLS